MIKAYQVKWCIRLIVILLVSTLLLRQGMFRYFHAWEFGVYVFYLSIVISTCWFIHGFFLQNRFNGLNLTLKHVLSNLTASIAATSLYYTFHFVFPTTNLLNDPYPSVGLTNLLVHFVGGFFVSVICYIIVNNLYTNDTLQKTVLENEQLKQAHLRAQLLSLQQQVSPHFLFNSLSTLKTITQEKEAKDYIVQLSKVYRHLLNFNEYHLTTLKDELDFLSSYLYILNLRFEDSLVVSINIGSQYLSYSIPPLSLQLLVENAIKHNVTSPGRPLKITITTTGAPAIIVENNFSPKTSEPEGTGMGLQNINDRYLLLVHQHITIISDPDKFAVTLPLLKI